MSVAVETSHAEEVEVALTRLASIDFSLLRMKLEDPTEGHGWSTEKSARVEALYRRFLALTFAYRTDAIVPTKEVDEFWHQHILDTRAYARDTVAVFGEFLHHFPYFGLRGEADRQRLEDAFTRSRQLYVKHWPSDSLDGLSAACESGSCSPKECSSCSRE